MTQRPIDANALLAAVAIIQADETLSPDMRVGKILLAITEAQTVDAVEVIRCEDCEKWDSNHYCERAAVVELPPLLEAILYQTAPDDFCSRAVRRVNNETEQQTAAEPAG